MTETVAPYLRDPWVMVPYAAVFIIVYLLVIRSLRETDIFPAGSTVLVALCVTALGVCGIDRAFIRPIMASYAAMGIAMLVSLALLLLATWLAIARRGRRR